MLVFCQAGQPDGGNHNTVFCSCLLEQQKPEWCARLLTPLCLSRSRWQFARWPSFSDEPRQEGMQGECASFLCEKPEGEIKRETHFHRHSDWHVCWCSRRKGPSCQSCQTKHRPSMRWLGWRRGGKQPWDLCEEKNGWIREIAKTPAVEWNYKIQYIHKKCVI